MSWITILASLFGAFLKGLEWLLGYQQRRAGRVEAERDALAREAGRAKEAAEIDRRIRAADPAELERLRRKWQRD